MRHLMNAALVAACTTGLVACGGGGEDTDGAPTTPNTVPVPEMQSLSTPRNTAINITLAASDPDPDPLTFSIEASAQNGRLTGSGSSYTYTPNADFQGGDRILFRVSDGRGGSAVGRVDISVVNRAPTASNQSFSSTICSRIAVALDAQDADGDTLTYTLDTPPTRGTLTGTAPNFSYLPARDGGNDSFTYTVRDGRGGSTTRTVTVAVSEPTAVPTGDAVALTGNGRLVHFNRSAPATTIGSTPVFCVAEGETLVGMDSRPTDNELWALSSAGKLYKVNASTGKAAVATTLVANAAMPTTTCSPAVTAYSGLVGAQFGVDFNPVPDRLRVVSNTGQNLRINVDTGETTVDCALNGAATGATAVAYTNSFANPVSTTLFYLDSAADRLLVNNGNPNLGGLNAVGPLGVNAEDINAFEIDGGRGEAFAVVSNSATAGAAGLVRINLSTGAATAAGDLAGATGVIGLALRQPGRAQVFALGANNSIYVIDPRTPDLPSATLAVTGLRTGETLIGMDFRPADGKLYLVGNRMNQLGGLYTVDTSTGAATLLRNLGTIPAGALFGVDFNPVPDRLRIVSDTENNYRCNVDDGAVITDGMLATEADGGSVVATAYTNNFSGTTSTTIFYLDALNNFLHTAATPNTPTLTKVGTSGLGVTIAGDAGFDIAGGHNGLALAAISTTAGAPSGLYNISLTTGAATAVTLASGSSNRIGGASGSPIKALSIAIPAR